MVYVTPVDGLVVEVAFTVDASTQDYLHLDDEVRGLLDTGTLAPANVWTDVTEWVRSGSVRRPSTRIEGPMIRYQAGTCTIVLRNTDRRFDPTNLDGPYVSGGETLVTPMRGVRVRYVYDGITYDLFRGYADEWDIGFDRSDNYSECVLTASDGTKVLAQYSRSASSSQGLGENSGNRISRILDSVGWSDSDRFINPGDSNLIATTLEGGAWDEMQLVAETELADLYIDGAGRVRFRNRQAIMENTRSVDSQATFGDSGSELRYQDVKLAYDAETIINLVRVTREGGTEQTASDSVSQTNYLTRTHERSGLLMQTDASARDYANFVLHHSKDPELRFSTLVVNPLSDPTNLWPQALGRDFGDRITVIRRPVGGGDPITRDVFIRGVVHDFPSPMQWMTTWNLQSATKFQFVVLDHPDLGVMDANNALGY